MLDPYVCLQSLKLKDIVDFHEDEEAIRLKRKHYINLFATELYSKLLFRG